VVDEAAGEAKLKSDTRCPIYIYLFVCAWVHACVHVRVRACVRVHMCVPL